MSFDPERSYRLATPVALRPEPFGALAYHYGTRRLNFLNSPDLVRLVECLGEHSSARSAFDSCAIDERRWSSFASALAALTESGFLELSPATAEPSSLRPPSAAAGPPAESLLPLELM